MFFKSELNEAVYKIALRSNEYLCKFVLKEYRFILKFVYFKKKK